LKVHTAAIAAGVRASSRIWEQTTLPGATTTVWVRGWFRISQLPVSTNSMEIMDAENPTSGDYAFLRATETTLYSGFGSKTQGGGSQVPTNTWFCLIWKIVRTTDTITDGSPLITYLRFGIYWAPTNVDMPQPAVDVWIDDIITDDAQLSCTD
jgi:hypothetical protein